MSKWSLSDEADRALQEQRERRAETERMPFDPLRTIATILGGMGHYREAAEIDDENERRRAGKR